MDMADSIKSKLMKAVDVLADKITRNINADDALKYTKAATNIADTIFTIENIEQNKK